VEKTPPLAMLLAQPNQVTTPKATPHGQNTNYSGRSPISRAIDW
jgi:hypothetical protein